MSDLLAIAAVTATLRDLLERRLEVDVSGTKVTTRPLDKARNTASSSQVNLFLYHTIPNPSWRNRDIPWRTKPGETGQPPLALELYYLVTAYYGQDEEGAATDTTILLGSHRLLGHAMSILHDFPLLDAETIHAILPSSDQLNHPYDQVERVRITPQSLSLDEMSKLWTGFQTQYRPSAAYKASVVLIESSHAAKTPLPVLTRGQADEGVTAQPDLTPPFPTLTSVRLPNNQPSAHLEDVLTLTGHHLEGDIVLFFNHPRLDDPIEVPPLAGGTATKVMVELPDAPVDWPAGFYTLAVGFKEDGKIERMTNELPFVLAPHILNLTPNPAARDAGGDVAFTVTCSPEVRLEQRAALLLGDREVPADPPPPPVPPESVPAQTDTLKFSVEDVSPGKFYVRLRVDGVDSLLVDRTKTPPEFYKNQKVTVE